MKATLRIVMMPLEVFQRHVIFIMNVKLFHGTDLAIMSSLSFAANWLHIQVLSRPIDMKNPYFHIMWTLLQL